MKPRNFVGIDVSKDKLDICVKSTDADTDEGLSAPKRAEKTWTVANTKAGCEAIVRRLPGPLWSRPCRAWDR